MVKEDLHDELFDLCKEVINSKKSANEAFDVIAAIFGQKGHEVSSILLDVLIFAEGETENAEDRAAGKAQFNNLVNLLMNTIIAEDILRAELECFEASKPDFTRQLIRVKTRVYFKQSKYNLLREESEGYAKLITELLEAENSMNLNHAKVVNTRVLALIGQFNLDPNRVTDIILECFEHCPKNKSFFISLLKEINAVREYLCAILGFKYTFYQGANKRTPYSLYVLTASLIQHDMIDMMKILTFMIPKLEEIKESHRARTINAQERAAKAETISPASMPNIESRSLDENPSSVAPSSQAISFTTVTQIQEDDDAILAQKFEEELVLSTNQKLGLACALLESENWKQAQYLMDRLPENYAAQASPRLCRALAKIIEKSIDDFYRTNCSKSVFNEFLISKKSEENEDVGRGLKKVTNWDELGKLTNILWYLGPRIAFRATANVKLLRLLIVYFKKVNENELEKNEPLYRTFVGVVAECVLPSLTLSDTNVALSEEIWNLVQMFPYTWRYWMYSKWNEETDRIPEMKIMRGKIYGRTKYVLKRLSKETVKVMGRQLGKLCHIHPITVLSYLLSQVQTFDNLIGPVVDGLRFLTSLEFDVLTYCIISQLADPKKQALKSTDATISPWLQALGTLVGSLYRRYPMELHGMLDYVLNQLKFSKSFDLLLLREIIQNMSWIESATASTKDQIEALGGGELLRQEAGGYSTARNKRAAQRLRDTLLKGDLAIGLCISIAQQKNYIVFEESDKLPLKLVGEMVDQCGDTLQQLVSFLISYLKNDEYAKRFPSVRELLADYSIPVESAMSFARPTFIPNILENYDAAKKLAKSKLDVAQDGQKPKMDTSQKLPLFFSAFNSKVEELSGDFNESIDGLEQRISLKFYTVFWMLGNYDIEVPTAAYERTIENLKKQTKDDEHGKSKKGEETRIKHTEAKLKEEQKRHGEHVDKVRKWLESVKDTLVEKGGADVSDSFLQLCLLPRALFSELDAVFCGTFFFELHQMRTPAFPTVYLINKIFDNVLPLISGLTEIEANSLSRFFEILLNTAQKWHADEAIFNKECLAFPGMNTKSPVDWNTFRILCYKWQVRLQKTFHAVIQNDNSDYVVVRNCLILMTKVRDREKGKRDDLSLKAASYVGRLKMRNVKIYENSAQFAPIAQKKKSIEKSKKTIEKVEEPVNEGEPVEKKIRVDETKETKSANGGVEKENKTEKKSEENGTKSTKNVEETKERKKRPKAEIYVPKKVSAEKEKAALKKEAEKPEEGEVRTPTPPPVKKSRLSDRIKKPDEDKKAADVEKHKKADKTRDSDKSKEKDRRPSSDREKEKDREKDKIRKREKENGDEKKDHKTKDGDGKRRESKEPKELREVAGPTLPDSLNHHRSQLKGSKEKEKKSSRSESSESRSRKEKDKKEVSKVAKIAEPTTTHKKDRRDRSTR